MSTLCCTLWSYVAYGEMRKGCLPFHSAGKKFLYSIAVMTGILIGQRDCCKNYTDCAFGVHETFGLFSRKNRI